MKKTGTFAPDGRAVLRILASTDLHMNLLGHDYYSDAPDPSIGLSRTATLISAARKEAAEMGAITLLLDNGDGLQGAPLGDLSSANTNRPHPLMRAFQVLKYDAIGLGNHDFNYGLETLTRTLADAPCVVLCSNMTGIVATTSLPFVASAILHRTLPQAPAAPPIKIGLLSVLPPQTLSWDSHLLAGRVEVADMVTCAQSQSAALRAAGCDLVIALAHTGLGDEAGVEDSENVLHSLAQITDIDALIGGHTHLHLPDPAHPFDKPVVMPGAMGSHLGVIDLRLHHGATGWRVTDWQCELRSIARRNDAGLHQDVVDEEPVLVAALAKDHAATQAQMRQPAGHSPHSLHSYFSFFGTDRALALVASAQAAALRALLVGSEAAALPLLSAAAPGKFGARAGPGHYTDVAAGALSLRHVADLHVFPNELRAVIVTGAELLEWLEMSAGQFNQIAAGSTDAALIDAGRAGHNFDVLHGLDYQIDVSQPSRFRASGTIAHPDASRIRNIRWNDAPLDLTQKFVVAVNSYRVSGGGNFAVVQQAKQLELPPLRLRDMIRDYLKGTLPADPLAQATPPWRLAPMPGTTVTALTGPAAHPYLDELEAMNAIADGLTSDGFLKLRLSL